MNENAAPAAPTPVQDVTGLRIVAAFIDIAIFIVIFVVMAMLFGESESDTENGASFNLSLGTVPTLILFVIWFLYFFWLEMSSGQTLGKKLTGIKVVTVDGSPLTGGKAALRTILRIIDGLPVFYLLGFIIMLVSKQKQRLGDMAAGTIVVKA